MKLKSEGPDDQLEEDYRSRVRAEEVTRTPRGVLDLKQLQIASPPKPRPNEDDVLGLEPKWLRAHTHTHTHTHTQTQTHTHTANTKVTLDNDVFS